MAHGGREAIASGSGRFHAKAQRRREFFGWRGSAANGRGMVGEHLGVAGEVGLVDQGALRRGHAAGRRGLFNPDSMSVVFVGDLRHLASLSWVPERIRRRLRRRVVLNSDTEKLATLVLRRGRHVLRNEEAAF